MITIIKGAKHDEKINKDPTIFISEKPNQYEYFYRIPFNDYNNGKSTAFWLFPIIHKFDENIHNKYNFEIVENIIKKIVIDENNNKKTINYLCPIENSDFMIVEILKYNTDFDILDKILSCTNLSYF